MHICAKGLETEHRDLVFVKLICLIGGQEAAQLLTFKNFESDRKYLIFRLRILQLGASSRWSFGLSFAWGGIKDVNVSDLQTEHTLRPHPGKDHLY